VFSNSLVLAAHLASYHDVREEEGSKGRREKGEGRETGEGGKVVGVESEHEKSRVGRKKAT
jgi:hypothetical protein